MGTPGQFLLGDSDIFPGGRGLIPPLPSRLHCHVLFSRIWCLSAAAEQQFSVTAPNCQYRISARQATKTRAGKIPPWFLRGFSAALFQGPAIHRRGAAACDPSGEAAQPRLFTPLPAHVRSPHIPHSATFCLSRCSQRRCPSRLGQEPAPLQLSSSAGHLQPTRSHIPVEQIRFPC